MDTKREFRYFSIVEYEEEQDYLRAQHQSGWRFVRISGFCVYHFEACEPEDVVYQLDYNQDGLAHRDEYVKMFADCGWEYLQDYVGYSYFRKPASEMNGDEEIFCNESSRAQMLERVFKGRFFPMSIIFLCILIPQFTWNLYSARYPLATLFGLLIVSYAAIFAVFARKYLNYKKDR